MTAEGTIDYEALAQEAMRGVVRTVLKQAADVGLPGDHHFYVSFNTLAPGVILSKRLREKYADEMTIVLQHRFWDLIVSDERFEVKLTFDGIPERLVVPYSAIKVFFDPSVRYGLQFETNDMLTDLSSSPSPIMPQRSGSAPPISLAPLPFASNELAPSSVEDEAFPPAKPAPPAIGTSNEAMLSEASVPDDQLQKTSDVSAETANEDTSTEAELGKGQSDDQHKTEHEAENNDETDESGSAEIVSLDAFRKK